MNELQEDKVWVGMAISVFITVTMFYALHTINHNLIGNNIGGIEFAGVRERFIATLAVFFNIIPFVIYLRVRKDNCMRGVGIVTVLLALFMLVYYYILGNSTLLN
jgi:hypothetical protein